MEFYPRPKGPGRPKTSDRETVSICLDKDIIGALRVAKPGKISDEVNAALRFYYAARDDFLKMKRELEELDGISCNCLKCHSKARTAWPIRSGITCPECGGRLVALEVKA